MTALTAAAMLATGAALMLGWLAIPYCIGRFTP